MTLMQILASGSSRFPFWSGNIITSTGDNFNEDANICNNYWRRYIIKWVYTSAELTAISKLSSGTISGIRFSVTQQPTNQPLPNYAIGLKNGTFGTNDPGNTGYTVVKSASSESFTTGTVKTFTTTDFAWTGNDIAIVFAWGQCPTNYSSTGTSPIGSGNAWYSGVDTAGTYVINTNSATTAISYRPVLQFYFTK